MTVVVNAGTTPAIPFAVTVVALGLRVLHQVTLELAELVLVGPAGVQGRYLLRPVGQ